MPLKEDWKKARERFDKNAAGHIPADAFKKVGKCADFAPSLEKFERAKNYDERKAAIPAVLKAKTTYVQNLDAAEKTADSKGKDEVKILRTTLLTIWKKVEDQAQPPKPSGRAEKVEIFYARNAAGGIRPKWLEMGALDIKVYLVIDETAAEMLKKNELGYTFVNFTNAINKEVQKSVEAFKKTIEGIDAKINILSGADRNAKTREANEVLKHYTKIVENNVNQLVDKLWGEFQGRKDYLKQFQKMCKIDITVGTIAIVTSGISLAASWGVGFLNVLAIAKAFSDITITLDRLSRTADESEKVLDEQIPFVINLLKERAQAKKDNESQLLGKAGETAKEAANVIVGKISASLFKSVSVATKTANEFYGKLSVTEGEAAKMYKGVQEFAAKLPSSPDGTDARVDTEMRKMHDHFKSLKQQFEDFNKALQSKIKKGKAAITACTKAKDEDAVPAFVRSAGGLTGLGVALASTGKFLYTASLAVKGLAGL